MNNDPKFILGLRAFAIILIIIDHFVFKSGIYTSQTFPYTFLRDGMNGIFLIFVIESYAFTRGILKAKEQQSVSIFKFWLKRVIQYIPCLYLFLFFIHYSSYFPGYVSFESFLSGITLTFNYLGKPHNDIVMHLWAICGEQAFAFVFSPLIILLNRKRALKIFILIALISVFVRGYVFYSSPDTSVFNWWKYMENHLILFGSCFGVIVALTKDIEINFVFKKLKLHWIAISFLIILGPYCESIYGVPFAWLYKPITSTLSFAIVLKYISVYEESFLTRTFSIKPLVWVGTIYFSLYLWQQPFTFSMFHPNKHGVVDITLFVIYSFAAGLAAYFMFELPLKKISEKIKY